MKKSNAILALLILSASIIARAQLSIVNIQLTPFNITPESMLSVTIMNSGEPILVETTSKLYNSENQLLLTVKSAPFNLTPGLNNAFSGSRKSAMVEYTNNGQANYLKTTRGLPSGDFKICVQLTTVKTSEIEDEFCDEVISDFNHYLYLVSPSDKDSIEIKNPMLIWAHSEPFNVLSKGESFRMIVSEIKAKQSAEEAISLNVPIMTKNSLTTHNLQYPYEARELVEGARYAWQVSKISNGVVVAQTDVWEFSIAKKRPTIANYTALKTKLDGGYYVAKNNKVYFKLEEAYIAGHLNCKIVDSKRNEIEPKAKNLNNKNSTSINFKNTGYNQFEIDLEELNNISKGYYTLEITNERGEQYMLKFLVE